jgi:putative DNA-invertase from lambdoid prophage Rac
MSVIAAVAQFERDLLIERTISGRREPRRRELSSDAPPALANGERAAVLEQLASGISISQLPRARLECPGRQS